MVMRSIDLINKDEPLTTEKVKAFAEALELGEILPTIVKVRIWTSSSNFVFKEKPAKVTVLKKYPYLVETDYGIMSWNELVIGYCKITGMHETATKAVKSTAASGKKRDKAA